ncbi:MAG: glycosyltransferase family 4 protein [Alphaproteobacteria bacterium]
MNMISPARQMTSDAQPTVRVTMLGLRGFPNVQGGVERHVENLARELVRLGCSVEAIVRSPYVAKSTEPQWQGIRLTRVWSPRAKGIEPFVHTFLGVLRAAWSRPDILHIHGIGPAFFTPLGRMLGLNVVVTHHMANYENEKWNGFARLILRFGERAGMLLSQGRIAVSPSLAERMAKTYRVSVRAIPNGIDPPLDVQPDDVLQSFDLTRGRFFLTVARIDEQKRQLDAIAAFAQLARPGWKLVLVGGADYRSGYARTVEAAARETPGVVMLGVQTGEALAALYAGAGAFVLPSSHEGQPIAVLEALSYGCPVVLSDILPHREIGASGARYFAPGDTQALAGQLGAACEGERTPNEAEQARILRAHNWHRIAESTLDVYRAALRKSAAGR